LYNTNFASQILKQTKQFMKTHFFKAVSMFSILSFAICSCDKDDNNDYTPPQQQPQADIFSAAGDSAAIIGTINQFRTVLGDSLNLVPGKTDGRREVNWDAVPATFTNNSSFPVDFFNSTNPADPNGRKRGLVYVNAGTGFRVDSTSFSEIDPSYANQFAVFSRKRLITQTGNNVFESVFKVAGTNTDAFIHGFGAIFSDVDDANSTTLEFFNGSKSLGIFKAKTAAQKFSFLGVYFQYDKVTSVKFTTGNGVLANGTKDISDGGSHDLVVLDDVFYNEPNSIQ
jgi:hypothetical protein